MAEKRPVVRVESDDGPSAKRQRENEEKPFACDVCGKRFGRLFFLTRHKKEIHTPVDDRCCLDCPWCDFQSCSRWSYFKEHCKKFHSDKAWKCGRCGVQYTEEGFFSEAHTDNGECLIYRPRPCPPLQPLAAEVPDYTEDAFFPPPASHSFWQDPVIQPYRDDPAAVELLTHYWKYYRQRFVTSSAHVHNYFFRLVGTDVSDFTLANAVDFIYKKVNAVFNINIGTTILLKSKKKTGPQYEVFIAQNNRSTVFKKSLFVHDLASLALAKEEIAQEVQLEEKFERPSTSWQFVCTLGVVFYVNIRPSYVAGRGGHKLPGFLSYDRFLVGMESDQHRHHFDDSLCLFRCLVHHSGGDYNDKSQVLAAYERYMQAVGGPPAKQFCGVPENDLALVEALFGVRLQVYRKSSPADTICLRKAVSTDLPIVNLHSWPVSETEVHFSFIVSLPRFAGKNICNKCNRIFKESKKLKRHENFNCTEGRPTCKYPGGTFENPPSIFERLLEVGIVVAKDRQFCQLVSGWDMEAVLEPVDLTFYRSEVEDTVNEQRLNDQNVQVQYKEGVSKVQKREKHLAVTGAVYTTVPGFPDSMCFDDEDPEALIKQLHSTLEEISKKSYELEKEKFKCEFEKLESLHDRAKVVMDLAKDKKKEKASLTRIENLMASLDRYCKQHVVLGFNSGRYDLKLVKKELFASMVNRAREARNEKRKGGGSFPRCITRGNTVMALTTDTLKFLDLSLFIAPGFNLAKFVHSFTDGQETKGHFCYEFARTRADLLRSEFPPKSAFWSTLKNKGITDAEYEECVELWSKLPEKTLLEFLKAYNVQDTGPMVHAGMRMAQIYFEEFGLDPFKQAVSVPGLTMLYLFNELARLHPTVRFGLFGPENGCQSQELYQSIAGGLSTLNMRLVEAGVTPIRDDPSVVVLRIEGYDFNALYLHSMAYQEMPTGHPECWVLNGEKFVRDGDTEAERLKKRRSHGEVEFMRWASWVNSVPIRTCEDGKQTRLGLSGYRADGWCKADTPRPTAVFYNGCRYHRHSEKECLYKDLDFTDICPDIAQKDSVMYSELESLGINCEVYWECRFKALKKLAYLLRAKRPIPDDLAKVIDIDDAHTYNEYLANHVRRKFRSLKEVQKEKMVNAIMVGSVFGFVKCSIHTPEHLKPLLQDFPPVITQKDVALEDLNDYMKEICRQRGALKKPRRCLMGCYKAEQIWVFSPLVKFYHEHGIEVFDITECIQYTPNACFKFFGEKVTEKRMEGDRPGANGLVSDAWKLFGNSGYGKTITRLERHKNVQFINSIELDNLHNSPFHDKTIPIADDCFEVHSFKKTINYNYPHCVGLATYAYAKLRMLQFYYDVLLKYYDTTKFNLVATDTDSLYLAIAGETLYDCLKPELRDEFKKDVEPRWMVLDPRTQRRVPGLLKTECIASHMCCLCSKTYSCYDERESAPKQHAKAKGVQKRAGVDFLCFENYKKILLSEPGANSTAFNMSIRAFGSEVFTTVCEKQGLTPVFVKRHCLPSGHTYPIDI